MKHYLSNYRISFTIVWKFYYLLLQRPCSENVGLLGLTHVGSRRVVQISTVFMIFFSIFGEFYLCFIFILNSYSSFQQMFDYKVLICRKIWGLFCIDTFTNICSYILCLIWHCWWVLQPLLLIYFSSLHE